MYRSQSAMVWLCGCVVALAIVPHGWAAQGRESAASAGVAGGQSSAGGQREIARARRLLEAGSNDQAIAILRGVLREEPESGDAHLLLGSALAMVPERSEALKELQRAVELQPASALAHFSLGTVQARFGDPEAAQQSFEKALQLDPGFAEAHVSLAMILGQKKELAAAREHLAQSIRIYGNAPPAAQSHYLLAQILLEQNAPDQALAEVDTAISLRPNYAEAFVAQGLIRKWQHNNTAAIAAFKRAAALAPDNFDAQYELGSAYLRAPDASAAVAPLRQAAALKPDDRSAWYQLCMALQKAGKLEDAKACRQELSTKISAGLATTANELSSTQANNAGVELEKAGNLTGALEKYREAVKLAPKVTVFRRNMALALCRLGRWDEGIAELHEVLKEDPDDAQATKALYIALENARAGKSTGAMPDQSHPEAK
jgi:tetratricopeptide (TPR) repeat protein